MSFDSLGLSAPLLKAIKQQGYEKPSPIQEQAIPAVLKGRDVMAAAQTGTGKTAGFTLPILEILSTGAQVKPGQARVLILTPTRELAAQIEDSVKTYGKFLPITSTVVFGGVKINPQINRLRKGVDILVATPGRLLDLHNQKAIRFDKLEMLVLDEADRMLDMGFIHDIRKIISTLPKRRQNLMFSATFSQDIRKLAKSMVNDPVEISVSPRNTTVETVKQWIHPVDKGQKSELLAHLIVEHNWFQVLVFSRTKHGANRLAKQLETRGIPSIAIHGNKSQAARTRALADFKKGKVQVMVATDIAARGIDIDLLPQVVNFDLPNVPEDYVHRIGRTGRAGSKGQAVSLVSADEFKQLRDIENLINQQLERILVDGFEPNHDVPASNSKVKSSKPRKNAQNRSSRNDNQKNSSHKQRSKENHQNQRRKKKNPSNKGNSNGGGQSPRRKDSGNR
ncbi:MAG: DEAD/DEAH box helicase [Cocleimonas sp.]